MAYDALNPLATAPANVITIASKTTVVATAAKLPAGTLIFSESEKNLYICIPDFANPSVMTAYTVGLALAPA